MSWTSQKTAYIKRAIWAESGGRIAGGSGSSLPPRCWRILSKQGMECTPVFHNLFPHSSPLHVYKQSSEEKEKESKRVWDTEGPTWMEALEICQRKTIEWSKKKKTRKQGDDENSEKGKRHD